MKHSLCKLLFLLFISLWVNCFADCNCPEDGPRFIACPKTYVTFDQIAFYENGIFVQVNDCIIQTKSLSTDAQGIFFENTRDNGCGPSQWKCEKRDSRGMICNTCNWEWNYRCQSCGKEKK
jgi:hypothetical protein